MSQQDSLLAEPIQPGPFRQCPKCAAWFALTLIRSHIDDTVGEISIYYCTKCDSEIEFTESHPPDAI